MKKVMIDGKEYWQQKESDIPKIPMPIDKDILTKNQPDRLSPETRKGSDSQNTTNK